MDKWNHGLLDIFADPAVCCLTCCCPFVTYGLNATKVHGGSCVQHGGTYCLALFCGLQGLFGGPTRKAIRDAYKLPQVPSGLGDADPSDFLVHALGIVACFALCQEANELKARNPTGPLAGMPTPFEPATQTIAPKQVAMEVPTPAM